MGRDDRTVTQAQEPILLGGYAAKQCPVRVQNDYLPLVPTLKWEPSPEDQARLDAGNAFEASVFEDLAAIHPSAVVVESQLSKVDAIAMTVQAMDSGAPLILGGWLPNDVGVAAPASRTSWSRSTAAICPRMSRTTSP